MQNPTGRWSARGAADACFRQAAAPTTHGYQRRAWQSAGEFFRRSAEAEASEEWGKAAVYREEGFAKLTDARLRLDHAHSDTTPSLETTPAPAQHPVERRVQMVGLCGLRAQSLRHAAERAPVMQAERGAVQYGAAAALERAADLWGRGDDGGATAWMKAAEHVLSDALIPLPWKSGT